MMSVFRKRVLKALPKYVSISAGNHLTEFLIMDTPRFFDTSANMEETNKEIKKCIALSAPGPHAFLLVVSLKNRFTDQDYTVYNGIENMFGKDVMKHVIVCFTGRDDLEGMAPNEYIKSSPKSLNEILILAGGRYVTFNNKGSDKERENDVRNLIWLIDEMLMKNGGSYYTSQKYQDAENIMQEKITRELKQKEEEMRMEMDRKLRAEIQKEREYFQRLHEANIEAMEGLKIELKTEKEKLSGFNLTANESKKRLRELVQQEMEIIEKEKKLRHQLQGVSGVDKVKLQCQMDELRKELKEKLSQIKNAEMEVADEMYCKAAMVESQLIREEERQKIQNEDGLFGRLRSSISNIGSALRNFYKHNK